MEIVSDINHIASLGDHCAVHVKVIMDIHAAPVQGKIRDSYWKLNTAILTDEEFLPSFQRFWLEAVSQVQEYVDIATWWDEYAKPRIKDFCFIFSVKRKERREQTKLFLSSYLKILLEKKEWEEIGRIKEKLRLMLQEDATGFLVRSRYNQNLEEEQASLFHASKEVSNRKNTITKLKVSDQIVNDTGVIESEVTQFF